MRSPLATALLAAALVAAATLVIWPSLRGSLLWDDGPLVIQNPLVTGAAPVSDIWLSGQASDYYPLTWTSFRLQHAVFGERPLGYRVVNLALHALTAIVLWRILLALGARGAWLAALLFAIHPLAVGTAAWISEQKNTLAALLAALSVLAWLRALPVAGETPRRGWLAAAWLAFVLALLAKLAVVLLPLVLALLAWWRAGRWRRADLLALAPFVVAALALGALAVGVQHAHEIAGLDAAAAPWATRGLRALWACGAYVRLWLLPVDLMAIYPWPAEGEWPVACAAGAALLIATALLVAWRSRPAARAALVGLLSYLLLVLPTLGLVEIRHTLLPTVADHYAYFGLAPLAALSAAALVAACRALAPRAGSAALALVAAPIALGLGALGHEQARLFVDAETLLAANLQRNPQAWLAHDMLGALKLSRGELAEAERHLRAAIGLQPDHASAWNNLGLVAQAAGRVAEAEDAFRQSLVLRPGAAETRVNLARLLADAGRTDEARAEYERALAADPRSLRAASGLGSLELRARRYAEAEALLRGVHERRPDDDAVAHRLGLALCGLRRDAEAEPLFRRAIALEPSAVDSRAQLAALLLRRGDRTQAAAEARAALALQPDHALALDTLRRAGG